LADLIGIGDHPGIADGALDRQRRLIRRIDREDFVGSLVNRVLFGSNRHRGSLGFIGNGYGEVAAGAPPFAAHLGGSGFETRLTARTTEAKRSLSTFGHRKPLAQVDRWLFLLDPRRSTCSRGRPSLRHDVASVRWCG
jgi:hypothetical protein